MDVGIDTGDMILQAKLPIAEDETGGSLFDKMAQLGADLLIEALEQLEAGCAVRIPQDNDKATYVKTLNKDMGVIDFNQPAVKLERLIRGLNPWPSAYTYLDGKTLKLWKAKVESSQDNAQQPGQVTELRKNSFVVATGDGSLVIEELQLEGKKRMSTDAFLRGYPIALGTVLG
jgi:methionyl-tRNA formyltransferase